MTDDKLVARDNPSRRQREILRTLVEEYIAQATPVGSSTVLRISGLDCSSATIRNELAALEEAGYVYQPHTSAGRVPTIKGYRYFVEQLMGQVELAGTEKRTIRHQFHQIRPDLSQWMRLTAAVLARSVQSASVVTPPHAVTSRFRHLELISTHDTLCLLILVLQDSSIHQEMLITSTPISQDTLSNTSNKLNALLANKSVQDIQGSTNPDLTTMRGLEKNVLQRVVQLMDGVDQSSIQEIYSDGLVNILGQPEFGEVAKFRQMIEILEHSTLLEPILARMLNANGVQIIIGGDGKYEQISDVTLVLSPYGIRGKASGVLGIMGPTRMRYAHAISTVQYIAHLMDMLVLDMYSANAN